MNNKNKFYIINLICLYFTILITLIFYGLITIEKEIQSFESKIEMSETVEGYISSSNEMSLKTVTYIDEFIPYNIDIDDDLQKYIIDICSDYNISPALVMSVIYYESNCNPNVCGDDGYTYGLMGINTKWCKDIMEKVGCYDMTDPYQNVTVGIDILADKLYKYDGNPEMALMAYNAGDYGADFYWFSNYIYSTEYSRKIMSMTHKFEEMSDI